MVIEQQQRPGKLGGAQVGQRPRHNAGKEPQVNVAARRRAAVESQTSTFPGEPASTLMSYLMAPANQVSSAVAGSSSVFPFP